MVEDDLDNRLEELAGEVVDEVIFFNRHTAVSNRPALTVHRIGTIPVFLYSVSLINISIVDIIKSRYYVVHSPLQ